MHGAAHAAGALVAVLLPEIAVVELVVERRGRLVGVAAALDAAAARRPARPPAARSHGYSA